MFLKGFSVWTKKTFWSEVLRIAPDLWAEMDPVLICHNSGMFRESVSLVRHIGQSSMWGSDWGAGRITKRFTDKGFGVGKAENILNI